MNNIAAFSHICIRCNEQAKEIEILKSDLEMFMDLCDKKDEWLEAQRKEIAELKIALNGWRNKEF